MLGNFFIEMIHHHHTLRQGQTYFLPIAKSLATRKSSCFSGINNSKWHEVNVYRKFISSQYQFRHETFFADPEIFFLKNFINWILLQKQISYFKVVFKRNTMMNGILITSCLLKRAFRFWCENSAAFTRKVPMVEIVLPLWMDILSHWKKRVTFTSPVFSTILLSIQVRKASAWLSKTLGSLYSTRRNGLC